MQLRQTLVQARPFHMSNDPKIAVHVPQSTRTGLARLHLCSLQWSPMLNYNVQSMRLQDQSFVATYTALTVGS